MSLSRRRLREGGSHPRQLPTASHSRELRAANRELQTLLPMSEHYLTTKSTHDRWNRDLAPQIEVEPGDVVKFDCFDSSGGQLSANSTVDDFLKIDRSKIHTLTGPVAISLGDVHAAQGDGEICINGIECPAVVTVRFTLLKDTPSSAPMLETRQRSRTTGGEWTMVESDEDPLTAARRAVNRMVDFLVNNWQFTPEHAYLLCSVAVDLRIHQVVNAPLVTVGATLPKSLLPLVKDLVIGEK